MKLIPLPLPGAFLIHPNRHQDERGYFARTFCTKAFSDAGLVTQFVQCSTSFNIKKGLIRGMHFQAHPYEETKLVRCVMGSIFDVIIDLRIDSASYQRWHGVELSALNGYSLYIPKGFAHGYQVLEDSTEVFYMMDEFYVPESAREMSPDTYDIAWPLKKVKLPGNHST